MIFNCNTDETKLVCTNDTYIARVWEKGEDKSFKVVRMHIDENLKWAHHISHIAKN